MSDDKRILQIKEELKGLDEQKSALLEELKELEQTSPFLLCCSLSLYS